MNRIARTEAFLKAKLKENPDDRIHPDRMAYGWNTPSALRTSADRSPAPRESQRKRL